MVVVVAGSSLLLGCQATTCTFDDPEGVSLRVIDRQTGEPICDAEVSATRVGATIPQSFWDSHCSYVGVHEEGRFVLLIHKEGYLDVQREVTVEREGDCAKLRTVSLQVDLESLP